MSFFEDLNREARARDLPFLVIGALAVNCHGFTRDSADLDLLVQWDRRRAWLDLLGQLGYVVERDAEVFVQLAPPRHGAWPVDLMLVREPTFGPLHAASREVELYGVRLRIPSLEHLLALKLHALKHGHAGRFLKDFLDVENLVRVNQLDLHSAALRELFLKYGDAELYGKVLRACSQS
jgi:hypothetical protein